MPQGRVFPREGLTMVPIIRLFQKIALNPILTLLLLLFATHTQKGRDLALTRRTSLKCARIFLYLGIYRWVSSFLNWGVMNNWQNDEYDWTKEIVVITGGSGGIGGIIVKLLGERGIKVAVLDVVPLAFETRTFHLITACGAQANLNSVERTLLQMRHFL